jgi:hypothetical protein
LFQQDGAPSHIRNEVRVPWKSDLPNPRNGRRAPTRSPTKSRPLTTGYFFLRGFIKYEYLVYADHIRELRHGRELTPALRHSLLVLHQTPHETNVCRAMNVILIFWGMHKNFPI